MFFCCCCSCLCVLFSFVVVSFNAENNYQCWPLFSVIFHSVLCCVSESVREAWREGVYPGTCVGHGSV